MTKKVVDESEATVKPFAVWLHEQADGITEAEWADALHQTIEAAATFHKPAIMTVQIKLTPVASGGAVEVVADVKLKLPTAPVESSLFYVDKDGNLSRRDPRQQSFETLRDVSAPEASPLKETNVVSE